MAQEQKTKRQYDRESYILVVDDDQTLLKFFKIHLNKFFSRVLVVKNAKEAIETLENKQIDLVLSDIRMPKVDGLQLLKKIKAHDSSIPVYLISGALLDKGMEDQIQLVADGFLRKPFTVEQIHEFIDQGMKRRERLKQLSQILADKNALSSILKGKLKKVETADARDQELAQQLISDLKVS